MNSAPDLPRRLSTIRRKTENTLINIPRNSIQEENLASNFQGVQTISASIEQKQIAPPSPPLSIRPVYNQADKMENKTIVNSGEKPVKKQVYSQPDYIRVKPRPGNWL